MACEEQRKAMAGELGHGGPSPLPPPAPSSAPSPLPPPAPSSALAGGQCQAGGGAASGRPRQAASRARATSAASGRPVPRQIWREQRSHATVEGAIPGAAATLPPGKCYWREPSRMPLRAALGLGQRETQSTTYLWANLHPSPFTHATCLVLQTFGLMHSSNLVHLMHAIKHSRVLHF